MDGIKFIIDSNNASVFYNSLVNLMCGDEDFKVECDDYKIVYDDFEPESMPIVIHTNEKNYSTALKKLDQRFRSYVERNASFKD